IVQIEKDITANVTLLNNAPPAALIGGTRQDPDPEKILNQLGDEIAPVVAIVSVFVLAPFAIAISRFIWKRSTPSPQRAAPEQTSDRRLDELQHSMDAMAIEIERISEGQRFVTKVLSER